MSELTLEVRDQDDSTGLFVSREGTAMAMVTPDIGSDYWQYRVVLSDSQAVLGFPKFGTIGIGFAVEDEDWNLNLPYRCKADKIAAHIDRNRTKGLRRAKVVEAIKLIQAQAHADRGTDPTDELD